MIKQSLFAALVATALVTTDPRLQGGSIFDDDFSGAQKETPPVRPAPKPAPEPAPKATEPKPDPTPEPPREVTPKPPAEVPKDQASADEAMQKKKADDLRIDQEKLGREVQIKKAGSDLASAKARAEKQAGEFPEYLKASAAADDAKTAYDEAKSSGSSADKAAAFSTLSKALIDKTALYKRLVSENKSYQQARTNASSLGIDLDQSPAQAAVVASQQKEDIPQNIADAIASHSLIEGMTLRQAKQASRMPCDFIGGGGSTKTYRWNFKGKTGKTTTEIHKDSFGRRRSETTADYGVIGYVEATFVNDKLTQYAKYSLIVYSDGRPKKVAGN